MSASARQPINWYACVIGAIVLLSLMAYLVGSRDLERAPFTESIQFCSVWILSWVITAAVVFVALSMIALATAAIALAQSWYTMNALVITGVASGIIFAWCLFIHLCPEPAQ